MTKKKKAIELSAKNLEFTQNNVTYKLIRFKPEFMTLDVIKYENDVKMGTDTLPFAHLPKKLKRFIKPN